MITGALGASAVAGWFLLTDLLQGRPLSTPSVLGQVILFGIAREQIPAQTIAPKFTGRFNKGVDYVGDPARFAWLVPVMREGRPRMKVGLMARGHAARHLTRFLSRPPVTDRVAECLVRLPLFPQMTEDEVLQ